MSADRPQGHAMPDRLLDRLIADNHDYQPWADSSSLSATWRGCWTRRGGSISRILWSPGLKSRRSIARSRRSIAKSRRCISTYADRDILQSGWLLGESVIAKKAAAVSVKHGQGRVVLLGFRGQNRDQTHGRFKMVFNALLNGPARSGPAAAGQQ
ncbi:MAG TPA: hypothetical protein PLH72_09785 [Vicinamibacterales bacterium]|nr:hypothetical protein [Vicinamibacterales bacterium]